MSVLQQVQSGRKLKALAIMLIAPHGIGKSTFATEAPKPVFVGQEENDELDVDRLPKIEKWSDLEDQLKALRDEDHGWKTLVLDTVDGLEQTAEKEILSGKNSDKTMATAFGGYGKAYEKMHNMFLKIRDEYLIPLRDKKGMNIVILAHTKKVKHEDPMTNTSYDHYETAIHKSVKPIFEDWVSAIFFANYYLVRAETSTGKEYAEGADGMRMIYTEERPSHVAKNRFNMPYEIEFKKTGTWAIIRGYVLDHFRSPKKAAEENPVNTPDPVSAQDAGEAAGVKIEIEGKMKDLPSEVQASVKTALKRAGDNLEELNRILKKVQDSLK